LPPVVYSTYDGIAEIRLKLLARRCRSNETGTWKEVFSELGAHLLGAHLLFLRNLEISNISTEILRSVVSQYYIALVWFDVITAEE